MTRFTVMGMTSAHTMLKGILGSINHLGRKYHTHCKEFYSKHFDISKAEPGVQKEKVLAESKNDLESKEGRGRVGG